MSMVSNKDRRAVARGRALAAEPALTGTRKVGSTWPAPTARGGSGRILPGVGMCVDRV